MPAVDDGGTRLELVIEDDEDADMAEDRMQGAADGGMKEGGLAFLGWRLRILHTPLTQVLVSARGGREAFACQNVGSRYRLGPGCLT